MHQWWPRAAVIWTDCQWWCWVNEWLVYDGGGLRPWTWPTLSMTSLERPLWEGGNHLQIRLSYLSARKNQLSSLNESLLTNTNVIQGLQWTSTYATISKKKKKRLGTLQSCFFVAPPTFQKHTMLRTTRMDRPIPLTLWKVLFAVTKFADKFQRFTFFRLRWVCHHIWEKIITERRNER